MQDQTMGEGAIDISKYQLSQLEPHWGKRKRKNGRTILDTIKISGVVYVGRDVI